MVPARPRGGGVAVVRVVEPGHVYELAHLGSGGVETLTFCRRNSAAITHAGEHPGTNTQEVIRALVDRTVFLNHVLPCAETEDAVEYLRMALGCYEARALRRKRQALNKEAGHHAEARERYEDVPFIGEHVTPWSEAGVESLLTRASDGHIDVGEGESE